MIGSIGYKAGRPLMTVLAFALLAGCGRQAAPSHAATDTDTSDRRGDINETRASIEAMRQNPSVIDESKRGKPLNLDPYAIVPPKHDMNMSMHEKPKDKEQH